MAIVSRKTVIEGINAIPNYSKDNELAELLLQAKSEYLLRDKLSLFFNERFRESGLFSIREWKNWEGWGIPLDRTVTYLVTNGWNGTIKDLEEMSKKDWDELQSKLPYELREYTWYKKGTAGVDLALFRPVTDGEQKLNNKPFSLESIIEFKCEVLHQLNPNLIDNKNYIKKDIERMKKFKISNDCSCFEVLCLVDFPEGINPIYYPLNNHYKANALNKNQYSISSMTAKLNNTYGSANVHYIPEINGGVYLKTKVDLHFWIIDLN
ncbi:hypothetical protein P8864_09460 [Priestia flexa]|uniref:hypothetical protein n=1 Tax=Priestia flexa TaxID=86664 RepID=UPI000C23EA94|nr:hypothetical protein [Priestia flexa]MEC0666126.1 hypothetical protein [Priestia flexa]